MSSRHDDSHERSLVELLAGEPGHDPTGLQELLAACPECRSRWEELVEVAGRLDASAAERAEVLAESARRGRDPLQARLEAQLEQLARESGARVRTQRWFVGLAAAAVVIATAALWRAFTPTGSIREPVPLGPVEDADWELEPPVITASSARFAWSYHRAAGSFVLRIQDADAPDQPPLEILCKQPSWIADAERTARIPRRFRWQVDALGASGKRDDWRGSSPWSSGSR